MRELIGDGGTHIFPTPSYTGVSEGKSASSFDVSCSIRISRCLVVIWALVTPICCCEAMARVSISCRIWGSLLLASLAHGRFVFRFPMIDIVIDNILRSMISYLLQGFVGNGHFWECGGCLPTFGFVEGGGGVMCGSAKKIPVCKP